MLFLRSARLFTPVSTCTLRCAVRAVSSSSVQEAQPEDAAAWTGVSERMVERVEVGQHIVGTLYKVIKWMKYLFALSYANCVQLFSQHSMT